MNPSTTNYQSYLLRLWQDSPQALWHVSLQSVQSHETIHFVDLDALMHFLWTHTTCQQSSESPLESQSLSIEQTAINSTKGEST